MPSYGTKRSNVVRFTTKPSPGRRLKKRMHHYKPGGQATPRPAPTDAPASVPSAAATPPPAPTSPPLSYGFDSSGGAGDVDSNAFIAKKASYQLKPSPINPLYSDAPRNTPAMMTEEHYADTEANYLNLDGLGAETGFFSDLLSTAADAYKARQQRKTAEAGGVQPLATRPVVYTPPGLLGMSTTTWLMLAGAGLGAYLLFSKKRR